MLKRPGLRLLKMGRYRAVQIAEPLKRAEEGLNNPLVALSLPRAAAPN